MQRFMQPPRMAQPGESLPGPIVPQTMLGERRGIETQSAVQPKIAGEPHHIYTPETYVHRPLLIALMGKR